jgi:SAM-dependent methyltransferase
MGLVLARLGARPDAAVYEMSAAGAFHRYLRRTFAHVTVSELFDDVAPGAFRDGVQCQDVQRLTYADRAFDVVTSTEVLEHVPDDRLAFAELHRVLRPHGALVFTVPLMEAPATLERARLEHGAVVHLCEPEYHGDRLRGRRAVLAFRTYGLDILDRLRDAGFEAWVERVNEPRHAIRDGKVVVGRKRA